MSETTADWRAVLARANEGRGSWSELHAALRAASSSLWTCPDCAFAFDAAHEDEGGGYSCPLCAERRAEQERDEARAERDALLEAVGRAVLPELNGGRHNP